MVGMIAASLLVVYAVRAVAPDELRSRAHERRKRRNTIIALALLHGHPGAWS